MTPPPPGSVDTHAHVMRRGAALVAERHSEPTRDIDVSEYLAVLDAHGIAHGVLTAPSFYGADNTLLLQALASAQGRLRGTVILDPEQPPDLAALHAQGIRGIRLNWLRRTRLPNPASPAYQRLFAAIREHAWHIELFLEGEHMPSILPHLLSSGARIVLDHFGGPEPTQAVQSPSFQSPGFQAVLDATSAGNTWVKLSAPYRLRGADPQPYVDALLKTATPARLLWASDWPWLGHEGHFTYQTCLDWLTTWIPDPQTRQTILAETPRTLFGF